MEGRKMKKLLLVSLFFGVTMLIAGHALSAETGGSKGDWHQGYSSEYGHGYKHGQGHGRGHGYGHGSGHGGMYGHDSGCVSGPRGWHDMTPEQQTLWEKMSASFKAETMEIRKQLATRQIELETLWAQPEVDEARIEKLSEEVADLKAQLWKKHDKYVLQCRQEFGDRGWECPGHGY
jgi:Spy/CpxP family protein refolding chaperone